MRPRRRQFERLLEPSLAVTAYNSVQGQAAAATWLPEGSSFYYDKDNGRVAKNGVVGAVVDLVTPFEANPGEYLWPIADVGITGDNAAVFLDVTFPSVPSIFSFIAELADDARGERVGIYASTDDVIGIDFYVATAYVDGGSSSYPITEDLRTSIAFTVGSGSLIWKLGNDDEVTKSGTMPTGYTKLAVGIKTDGFSASGITLHTLTVYNQKLDNAVIP